jgi:hypothetical protein
MMTCCALGDRDDQDAILGHVASRGDRFPRAANKTLAGRPVNGYVRGFFAVDHEQFSVAEGTFRRFRLDHAPGRSKP